MCGIFGYIGKKNNAQEIVFKGLKSLEYRGYDSWGIAIEAKNGLKIEKHIGKITQRKTVLPNSNIGIGHTRWATHGGVAVANAHPHLDCKLQIAVLHNGIVENFTELKHDLLKSGHIFESETDTEVISHLIEDFIKTENFKNAVRKTFNKLKGLNAIVVLNSKSLQIIAVKNGSPLIIGIGDGEYFISSDAVGILPYTRKVIFLKDNEMAVLDNNFSLFKLPNGEKENPKIETINWKIEEAEKGEYPHFMIKEIYEQPKVILNIAKNYKEQIKNLVKIIKSAQGTYFIGSGSASFACLVGTYLFSKIAKKHVNSTFASEFNYLEDFLNEKSLIIALSQSGETIDIVEPLIRAKKKKAKIIALTNVLGSTIYRMSDFKLLLGAGPEKAVASTKAYIAKVSILILLAYALVNNLDEGVKILIEVAGEIESMFKKTYLKNLEEIAEFLLKKEHLYLIGRGLSYPTAMESAMKIKEVSYLHAEALAGGELKHGSIALIDKGTVCFVFAPNDATYDAIMSNAMEIKSRGGIIIGISAKNSPIFDKWISVLDVESANAITHIIPMQIIAYFLAIKKRLDPDKPRNLAKSVTVK